LLLDALHFRGNPLKNGDLSQSKASLILKISIRQIKRLCKRYREEVQGLAHRGRGKESVRKINYPDFGFQLIKEQLEQRNHLQLAVNGLEA